MLPFKSREITNIQHVLYGLDKLRRNHTHTTKLGSDFVFSFCIYYIIFYCHYALKINSHGIANNTYNFHVDTHSHILFFMILLRA